MIGMSSGGLVTYALAAAALIGGALVVFVGDENTDAQTERHKHVVDFDLVTLRIVPAIFFFTLRFGLAIWEEMVRGAGVLFTSALEAVGRIYGPEGRASQLMATGTMVLWLAILLLAALSVNLLNFL